MIMRVLWITAAGMEERDISLPFPAGSVVVGEGAYDGFNQLRRGMFQVVVLDCPIGEWTPEELIEEIQRIDGSIPVIVRAAQASLQTAVRVMRLGAYYFLQKDEAACPDQLARLIESAAEYYGQSLGGHRGIAPPGKEPWGRMLVGESKALEEVVRTIRLVGPRRSTVLIIGETGTGKELVARAIHMASNRAHIPLVALNCTALPQGLLETELFGHVKGAFTGAVQSRAGHFEMANRGTMFLDEIGDLPLETQAKLLRVLQEREFQRLGSTETVRVDTRVICATNLDLAERVEKGQFREDLYYRLNVVPLVVPPLRERRGDIPALVHHFMEKVSRQEGVPAKKIAMETLERLMEYDWPGNVRQLENAIERAMVLSGNRECLYAGDFPLPAPARFRAARITILPEIEVPEEGLDFERTVGRIERTLIDQALRRTGGNKRQAAEMLRLKRTTLTAKLKSLETVAVQALSA
jgi:DNA-binding NtrC family response regulator